MSDCNMNLADPMAQSDSSDANEHDHIDKIDAAARTAKKYQRNERREDVPVIQRRRYRELE